MTLPPDDLPRSATGRVPQWVFDESAGRVTPSTGWRGSMPRPPTDRSSPAAPPPSSSGSLRLAGSRTRHYPPQRYGASGGGLAPWRQRLKPFLVGFVTLVFVVGVAARVYDKGSEVLAASGVPAAEAGTLARGPVAGQALPDRSAWQSPTAGVEEAAAPLGVAPLVAAPSTQYTFTKSQVSSLGRTVPVAWSPCRPIHYVVNLAGAPAGFADQVALAMAALTEATGLRLVADGATAELPASPRTFFQPELYGDRWVPVLIAFTDEKSLPILVGDVAGVGGYASVSDRTTGLLVATTGTVYLDTALLSQPKVAGVPAYVPVLRHELGHLVGLGHVSDPTQLMNPSTSVITTYQEGDLTGLAQLGRGACAPGV